MPRMALFGILAALAAAAVADDHPAAGAAAAARPRPGVGVPAGGSSTAVSSAAASAEADDPWSSPDIAAPRMDARPLPRRTDAAAPAASPEGPKPGAGAWLRTTAALAGVVGLIVLLGWGYRRVMASGGLGFVNRGRPAIAIDVVGRATLSPRQTVCLVRIGPRLVLVGCTPTALQSLDVITDAELTARLLGEAAQRQPDSHSAEFTRCLQQEAQPYEPAAAGLREGDLPDDSRLRAIRERLHATIQRLRKTVA